MWLLFCSLIRNEELRQAQAASIKQMQRYEANHLGGFRPIYPKEGGEKYEKYFKHSSSLFQETAASKAREECSRSMFSIIALSSLHKIDETFLIKLLNVRVDFLLIYCVCVVCLSVCICLYMHLGNSCRSCIWSKSGKTESIKKITRIFRENLQEKEPNHAKCKFATQAPNQTVKKT